MRFVPGYKLPTFFKTDITENHVSETREQSTDASHLSSSYDHAELQDGAELSPLHSICRLR